MLDRLGLGYDAMQEINPGLVYCALKGFLSGPYEQRAGLDEVVQMMGGLAYMTDPEGQPLRVCSRTTCSTARADVSKMSIYITYTNISTQLDNSSTATVELPPTKK